MPSSYKMSSALLELNKLGAISDEEARGALEQLEALEKAKPGVGQVGRYALVGSVAGPTVSMAREMLRKGPKAGVARYFRDVTDSGKKGVLPYVHHAAGDAAAGAVTSGAIPLLRASLDRAATEHKLKTYLRENSPVAESAKVGAAGFVPAPVGIRKFPTVASPAPAQGGFFSRLFGGGKPAPTLKRPTISGFKQTLGGDQALSPRPRKTPNVAGPLEVDLPPPSLAGRLQPYTG
jgi:hypothetical protein